HSFNREGHCGRNVTYHRQAPAQGRTDPRSGGACCSAGGGGPGAGLLHDLQRRFGADPSIRGRTPARGSLESAGGRVTTANPADDVVERNGRSARVLRNNSGSLRSGGPVGPEAFAGGAFRNVVSVQVVAEPGGGGRALG